MGIPKENPEEKFTYSNYKTWPEDERWELIHGEAYAMSPGPNRWHQDVLGNIADTFRHFFRNKKCKVYFAPFDVVLPAADETENDSETVVQPDLVVICDPSKLTDAGCTGAPDLAIEILSPSTAFRDMDKKLRLYEETGVREYWIVNPANRTIMIYRMESITKYGKPKLYSDTDTVDCESFPGLSVNVKDVFKE